MSPVTALLFPSPPISLHYPSRSQVVVPLLGTSPHYRYETFRSACTTFLYCHTRFCPYEARSNRCDKVWVCGSSADEFCSCQVGRQMKCTTLCDLNLVDIDSVLDGQNVCFLLKFQPVKECASDFVCCCWSSCCWVSWRQASTTKGYKSNS